jgi:hypothetical protein
METNVKGQVVCPMCKTPAQTPLSEKEGDPSPVLAKDHKDLLPPGFVGVVPFTETYPAGEFRGRFLLKYNDSLNIPGTNYCTVLPQQATVARDIVEKRCKELGNGEKYPMVCVATVAKTSYFTDQPLESYGPLVLDDDGHHTFVAALKAKVPIWLYLKDTEWDSYLKNWTGCTYVDSF